MNACVTKADRLTAIRYATATCSMGMVLVATTAKGICAIFLGDDPEALVRELQVRFAPSDDIEADQRLARLAATVAAFVESPAAPPDLTLDIRGTRFQRRVWQALTSIPAGTTASYAEIARRIGAPKAVRAVAQACGANAIAVAIPCHRIVRSDGSLSGYHWGPERKRMLLQREAAR